MLKKNVKDLGSVLVAFSGGVDSAFLLAVAKEVLGDRVQAVTAVAPVYPARELQECQRLTQQIQVQRILIDFDLLNIPGFVENHEDRCYLCKRQLFAKILHMARDKGINEVVDGSNIDDLKDFRPGMRAIRELHIKSPLLEVGLGKEEIRLLSRQMGLDTWDKAAAACLASRFRPGEKITLEKLNMVEKAEYYLQDLGFKQVRVRMHRDLARIEVGESERPFLTTEEVMDKIADHLRQLGFHYVTLDMRGYQMGSMNSGQIRKR